MTDLPGYAELHCISNFTFLRGASAPEELVERAHALGYSALAITDECSLCGVVRAHVAARERGIKLIVGSCFLLRDNDRDKGSHFVLLARNRKGYGELSHLITCARRNAAKGEYRLDRALLEANSPTECLALWIADSSRSAGHIDSLALWFRKLFAGRLWIAVELLLRGDDRRKLRELQRLGERHGIPLVATGGVCMHDSDRRLVQDVLTAIRLLKPVAELGFDAEPNGQRHLRHREQLAKLYPRCLLAASVEIAGLCHFSLQELRYEYPVELVPRGHTADSWLGRLTWQGARKRWPEGISRRNRKTLQHELALIETLEYAHFFLTVHDIVNFARERNIFCQGRGSAANSVVCYCLGITEVNPDQCRLLFGRFLSKERNEPPDIDVDFENGRREEVIQYIYEKYGRHRAAIAATVISYRARSALRDVGKALKLDPGLIEHLARSVFWWGADLREQLADAKVDHGDPDIRKLIYLTRTLIGFPRHLSQHVGGFVISQGPLSHLVPIENAAMPERSIIQWDKDDLESLGLLKVDVLALGMLTALHKVIDLVNARGGHRYTMHNIPREDPAVYDMICAARTTGVFQIESRAQMSMLPRLRPRNYYDLIIQIAIVRPGPIEGGMVHPYLQRRNNPNAVRYENDAIKNVLERTLGVPIFQEQVMELAMVGAGFTPGAADQLRRAMAAWKKKGGLEPFREKLINGFLRNGYSEEFSLRIYKQIRGFGEYGFPESHSASFAHLAYISSWFKHYHPAAFCCALLNSQPMGFYAPAQLIQDARREGVKVLPVDVNASHEDCTLEPSVSVADWQAAGVGKGGSGRHGPMLRTGFNQLKGLSAAAASAIVESRGNDAFRSVQDLVFRSGIDKGDLEALAAADALRGLSGDRHRAFWQASGISRLERWGYGDGEGRLHPASGKSGVRADGEAFHPDTGFDVEVLLPVASEGQNILADYKTLGFSLRRHPVALLRAHLDRYRVTSADKLTGMGKAPFVKAVGIVTTRQRPLTASGVTFVTIEDETGFINVVVWPALGEKQRPIVRQARLLGVTGHVQESDGVVHLIASHLEDLSSWLGDMNLSSRDFM